ncbi:MAG: lipo-like protein [Acidocella sp. 20-63-7]|nr:MAG: lipo-like protein [Acidocella sp. 20-63-7]HQT46713.1 YiiX/YebB-like N1pC/P60 family cysteine hydrolase [Acidocella sp.]
MNPIQASMGAALARFLTTPVETPAVLPLDIHALRRLLRPGDVILVEGNLRISTVIKYLTQSTWSHAVLYAGTQTAAMAGLDCIEADVVEGVRWLSLEQLLVYHVRICRPIGLSDIEREKIVAYAAEKIGTQYDLRYVFDLARYLVPLPVPRRWRRRAIAFLSADPSRAICSTLIANAFTSIGYPILPEAGPGAMQSEASRLSQLEFYHIHSNGLFVPRDFDLSPYFEVVKPEIPHPFDYHRLAWAGS